MTDANLNSYVTPCLKKVTPLLQVLKKIKCDKNKKIVKIKY